MTDIKKGLVGVTVDTTAVSKVMPDTNSLTYRGYAVEELCQHCRFEEVAYLLIEGELPTGAQLEVFEAKERARRSISEDMIGVIRHFPKDDHPADAHPMDTVRTGVSFLGLEDASTEDSSEDSLKDKALTLFAKIPTIIAADYRIRNNKNYIPPRDDLSFAENFFHMCFGEVPAPEVIKCFDTSLILYAEHSFNASTFTARVIASSMSDIYSAVVGAIGSLKGPLHGGANEAVMHMMLEVGHPDRAKQWVLDRIEAKKVLMGFGHRVYKNGDSRVPTMTDAFYRMAEIVDTEEARKWVEMSKILAETMIEAKGIHPNLDFPTGPAYYLMGFEIPMFTPIFVMSRITGWTAHIIEQWQDNKLIRPLSAYNGPDQRPVQQLQ